MTSKAPALTAGRPRPRRRRSPSARAAQRASDDPADARRARRRRRARVLGRCRGLWRVWRRPEIDRALQRPAPPAHRRARAQLSRSRPASTSRCAPTTASCSPTSSCRKDRRRRPTCTSPRTHPSSRRSTEHGLLAKLPASALKDLPHADAPPSGTWAPVALRVSGLAYSPEADLAVEPAEVGARPRAAGWKGKVAIAPTDSDFPPVVGAVLAQYGKAAAKQWLAGLKRNAQVFQTDEAVVAAVNSGRVAAGVINHYYWYRLRTEIGAGAMHSAALLLPGPQRRLDREHLRRSGAQDQQAPGARRRGSPASSSAEPRSGSSARATTSSTRRVRASRPTRSCRRCRALRRRRSAWSSSETIRPPQS